MEWRTPDGANAASPADSNSSLSPTRTTTAAFKDHIQFVLPLMEVRRMFLTGLKRVQSRKQEIALHQRALAHLVGSELCEAGYLVQKHSCTPNQRIRTIY